MDLIGFYDVFCEQVSWFFGGFVIILKDFCFEVYGLKSLFIKDWLNDGMLVWEWDVFKGEENIKKVE